MQKTTPNPSGILLINKEKGITSFGLVHLLRKCTGVKKIGHAGTLDPLATGLMILLIGKKFTTQSNSFMNFDKEYTADIFLGKSTTTYDEEGDVVKESSIIPTKEALEKALLTFQGKVMQTPPMFSAKKIGGKKLYEMARKGKTIERPSQEVEMRVTLLSYEYPHISLHIQCSKGTYVRSIAHDLGEMLQSGAHLSSLQRTRIGPFHLKDALLQQEIPKVPLDSYLLGALP